MFDRPIKADKLFDVLGCHKLEGAANQGSLSNSKYFDGIVPSIFDYMNFFLLLYCHQKKQNSCSQKWRGQYLSSWGHSRLMITNKDILI